MPRVNNLRTASTCRERQWHSARWEVYHNCKIPYTHLPRASQYSSCYTQYTWCILKCVLTCNESCHNWKIPYTHLPRTSQYTSCYTQYTRCILKCVLTYKESCHKCIRSWYFSWSTLKYTDHYTDLIHPASSLYLSYKNRYTDCVRPEEGPLYRPFYAVRVTYYLPADTMLWQASV